MSQGPSNPQSKNLGKKRSQRIQLDYYRHRTWLDRFRIASWSIGLATALAYVGFVVFQMQTGRLGDHVSTGPLTLAHAHFENDCASCHQDFRPINPNPESASSWWTQLQHIGISRSELIGEQADACLKCHAVGGHRPGRLNPSAVDVDLHCSLCHVDHQGRSNDLTLVSVDRCTQCHREPDSWAREGATTIEPVTAFDVQHHPTFASLQTQDAGLIQFDHHQHGLPGQVPADQQGGMTLGRLSPADQAKYRKPGQSDSDLVTLDCSHCHQMTGAAIGSGADVAPISFEQHCQACHWIESGVGGLPLPHAADWKTLNVAVAASINGGRAIGQIRSREQTLREQTMPGQNQGTTPDKFSTVTNAELAAARKRIEQQCLTCHDDQSITDESIMKHAIPSTPPMIPPSWLSSGFYDHAAHERIDCRFCHADAYPDATDPKAGAGPPNDHQKLMIRRTGVTSAIGLCTDCHRAADAPTPQSLTVDASSQTVDPIFGGMPTWGGDRCGICHRYHSQPNEPSLVPPLTPSVTLTESSGS